MSNKAKLPMEPGVPHPELLAHLRQLFESPAFKGSRRSQQFLQHIVDQTFAGQTEQLKERSLGVALFGRDPAYDTGEDAVVRVTASDVRKRLHQFYSENDSAVRIELVAGSYTPEFRTVSARVPDVSEVAPVPLVIATTPGSARWRRVALPMLLFVMAAVSGTWLWSRSRTSGIASPRSVLPWSVLFQEGRQLQLVLADPDVSAIQELTGTQLSLPDYANRKYTANAEALGSDMQRAIRLLRGVNVAAVDVGIALSVSRLAGAGSARMKIHPARSLQLSAFRTDDDFILLGSSRSNPWGALFEDQLEFDFVRDPELNREVVRNKRVRTGELARYVPTAGGWDTGDAYAIIALVRNPNQAGSVLLVAGTNAEGTEAAGQFVTNTAELARTLRANGIDPVGPACHFEILLRVRTMAGSPSTLDVVACHRLAIL
jgi:hypothetical protein